MLRRTRNLWQRIVHCLHWLQTFCKDALDVEICSSEPQFSVLADQPSPACWPHAKTNQTIPKTLLPTNQMTMKKKNLLTNLMMTKTIKKKNRTTIPR